jgi:hypothetical protein
MILKRLPWELRRKPRALSGPGDPPTSEPKEPTPSWEVLNEVREKRYEATGGVFLVHTWRPSRFENQVADVTIRLHQHRDGPLSRGEVRAVEYTLGPNFSDHSRVSTNPRDGFAIEESMWGPMLCLAKVYLTGDREPLVLERYINFEQENERPAEASPSLRNS